MLRRLALAATSAVLLASCGQGFSKQDAVGAFAAANPNASTVEATCVVDRLIEQYEAVPVDETGLAAIEAELLADPISEGFELDQFRAMFGCGMTDAVEAQLGRQIAARGIDSSAADCVTDELIVNLDGDDLEVLLTGEMSDEFFAKFFDASDVCGALPS